MAGTIVADNIQAASTSTLVLKNGVANTPPTIQDSGGTEIGTFCRAWVNFNGTTNTGGFCTISASFNVTSIADNNSGDYTINFTTAMPDADYAVVGTSNGIVNTTVVGLQVSDSTTPTASLVRINTQQGATRSDRARISVAIFR